MKNSIKIAISSLLLSSFALAGGNTDVTEVKVIEIPTLSYQHFYVGLGVSGINLSDDTTEETLRSLGAMVNIGYQYNDFIALEARYTRSIGKVSYDKGTTAFANSSDYPSVLTTVALYLKPSYKLGDFEFYGLVGYGQNKVTDLPTGTKDRMENSLSWGLGVGYAITENLSTFVDYTRPYQNTGFDGHVPNSDIHIDVLSVGVRYRF
jgi:opacity protein-like surface antigen